MRLVLNNEEYHLLRKALAKKPEVIDREKSVHLYQENGMTCEVTVFSSYHAEGSENGTSRVRHAWIDFYRGGD